MAEVKKPVAVAPKAEEKKVEPFAAVKAEPAAEKKVAAVKKAAAAKKPAVKKAAAAKKPAAKKAAAAKPAVKKAAAAKPATAKKTAAKPAAKKAAAKKVAVKASIQLEFDGGNIKVDVDKLASRAAKDYKKNFKADAKKIEIYINADERKIYYVADGNSGSFDA
ncbi:MAG: DUF6465 family protein [Lachnospiraceae bacterium]|nr:DUF6465 family protein [Lachnospiraceae bacterium]